MERIIARGSSNASAKARVSIQIFGCGATFFVGFYSFIQVLGSEFPLRVIGESFAGKIELRGGETFVVAPLYGLAQT